MSLSRKLILILFLILYGNVISQNIQSGIQAETLRDLYDFLNDSILKDMSDRYGQRFTIDTAHHQLARRYFGMTKHKGKYMESFIYDRVDLAHIDSIYSGMENECYYISFQESMEHKKKQVRTITFYFKPQVSAEKITRYKEKLKKLFSALKVSCN
jgi:hypothetical protein